MQKEIIIVGAGLSGLTAARHLNEDDHRVTVLDKGRGVGGRMATRRLGDARCDHGAQFFSARTPAFQSVVQEAKQEGVVTEFMPGHLSDSHLRWIGTDGMTALPKFLAAPLNVKLGQRVTRLSQNGKKWKVSTNGDDHYEADALILTMPAPQALALLNDSDLVLPDVEEALAQIGYHPCLAVLARLGSPTSLPAPGTLMTEGHPISWMADNYRKGITEVPSLTIHASPEYSRMHLERDLQKTANELLEMATKILGSVAVGDWQIHRWRYSLASQRYDAAFYRAKSTTAPLLFGGDGFGTGNVEGAFTSGLAMAESISG